MRVQFTVLAATALMFGASTTAQPGKSEVHAATPPATKAPAEVVVASADQARAPVPGDQPGAAQVKRTRVARVTTCRCGDPDQQSSESDQ